MGKTRKNLSYSESVNRALALAEAAGYEKDHTEQVRKLALAIFDGLQALHGLGRKERDLLELAAILHDIGWAEGGKDHHKTARDMILSTPLLCFERPEERIIVALVARYHKGVCPAKRHKYYDSLGGSDRITVGKLAAILRIADGLDRSHSCAVSDISVRIFPEKVRFLLASGGISRTDDAAAKKKSGLFTDVFGKNVELEWASE